MALGSKIEWTDATWNPIKMRCTKVSEGCQNCYAERLLSRNLPGLDGYPQIGDGPVLDNKVLRKPYTWRKPRRIFVESMGDLFHEDVFHAHIGFVMDTIKDTPQHTYIILTKRPERMMELLGDDCPENCWLGVTAENQQRADERIPILLQIPTAVRFVSVEPMLGPIEYLFPYMNKCDDGKEQLHDDLSRLDWVICGAETGPGARMMRPRWAIDLRDQCKNAGVPFFFKKWSRDCDEPITEMPREYPI